VACSGAERRSKTLDEVSAAIPGGGAAGNKHNAAFSGDLEYGHHRGMIGRMNVVQAEFLPRVYWKGSQHSILPAMDQLQFIGLASSRNQWRM
jgi:hypothetical protein